MVSYKRRKVTMGFPDLPPEIVHYIISFLPISVCSNIIRHLPQSHAITKLLYRSTYERSIFYGNHYLQHMTRWGLFNTSIKQVDEAELTNLVLLENDVSLSVLPKHFIFKYSCDFYWSPDCDQFSVMKSFVDLLLYSKKYFLLVPDLEIYIDLSNKHPKDNTDDFEVWFLEKILHSTNIHTSLTKLSLKRFQRILHIKELSEILESSIHNFQNLTLLLLDSNKIQSIDNYQLPRKITCLSLINNQLQKLPTTPDFFPPNLLTLNLSCNCISSLEGVDLPDSLLFLDIQLNSLVKLSGHNWPRSLRVLIASGNELQLCNEEINFPENLQILNLLQNPHIVSFNGLRFPNSLKRVFIDVDYEKLPINVPRKDSVIYA